MLLFLFCILGGAVNHSQGQVKKGVGRGGGLRVHMAQDAQTDQNFMDLVAAQKGLEIDAFGPTTTPPYSANGQQTEDVAGYEELDIKSKYKQRFYLLFVL